eukprot:Gb_27258 [translate_table: standard]
MAPKVVALELPSIIHLEFTDTHFGKQLLNDKNLQNYSDVYSLIERAETLFAEEEDILEDDANNKSDLLSLKASGLHKIVPDLLYNADTAKAFMKGKDLVKTVLKSWAEHPKTFKRRANLDYPNSQFRRGIRIGMMLLNRLYGEANTDHVNQFWGLAKPGRSFYMASYIVDACCTYLDFDHPLFPSLPNLTNAPIHALFSALYVHRYRRHIAQICTHFYPTIYRAIFGKDVPRIVEAVRGDLALIGAWWYFDQATIIRVEGTLTSPTILPLYVPERLVALEVARQCHFGVAKRCKAVNQKPYSHLPFKIGDSEEDRFYLCPDSWEEVVGRIRYVQEAQSTSSQTRTKDTEAEEVDSEEETDEILKQKLLKGLPTESTEVQMPPTTATSTGSSPISPTASIASSSVAISSSVGPSTTTPPGMGSPSSFKIPSPRSVFSPITPSHASVSPITLDAPITQGESKESSSHATSPSPSSTTMISSKKGLVEMKVTTPFDLSIGIQVSPLISLKPSLWDSPTFSLPIPPPSFTSPLTPGTSSTITIPTPPFITLIEYHISTSLTASKAATTLRLHGLASGLRESIMASTSNSPDPSSVPEQSTMTPFTSSPTLAQSNVAMSSDSPTHAMSKQQWIHMQLPRAEGMDTTTPRHPEVTLEYDKATSSLKKVNKRRIKTGEQVTTLQTEENLLSLTRKRKRGAKSTGRGSQSQRPRSPSQDSEFVGLDRQMGGQVGNPGQVLEDGDTPLVTSNRHLEMSSHNILSLFDNDGLPQVMRPDNTLCTETEFDATLGEFAGQFSKQLASVGEQGNQALHEFVVEVARKAERAHCVKEFLNPILTKHTKIVSKAMARVKNPIINTARINVDYDKCLAIREKGRGPPI